MSRSVNFRQPSRLLFRDLVAEMVDQRAVVADEEDREVTPFQVFDPAI
jgi:hypothetical protein